MEFSWKTQVFILLQGLSCAFGQAWDRSLYATSPPVYPSPNTAGLGGWEDALSQANGFLSQLTLDEKVQIVTGTPGPCTGNIGPIARLGFSGLCLQDGPLAIRQATYASVFPAGLTAAASWDKGLIYQRGVYLGEEFRGKGAHIALMPVAGTLGRSATGGRNWEGFSPDPYLTGIGMDLTIRAVQSTGVQTTSKHVVGNEQETQRNPSTIFPDNTTASNIAGPPPGVGGITIEAVSSNIDDRTMHEVYLWPFADSVHAGTTSIMCSYNRINASYGCENSKILNGILKDELGFQGYVMSDWGATHSGVSSVLAGLDMTMPGGIGFTSDVPSYWGANLTGAIQNGSVPEARLDDMVRRVMTPYFYLGQDSGFPPVDPSSTDASIFTLFAPPDTWRYDFNLTSPSNVDVRGNHAHLIRELGAAGTVLLKNVNNALPLRNPQTIGVFGNDAGDFLNGPYSLSLSFGGDYEFQTQAVGGGSGTGRFTYVIPPLDAIKARANHASPDGALVQYILNNTLILQPDGLSSLLPYPPEVCLVFTKTFATEGFDRTTLELGWNGTEVVNTIARTCNNTIVITHSGGLNILPFADNPNVTAILAAHFPGQESGNSIVDVLYGDVNPSGKLPYTIARNASDYNAPVTNSTELLTTRDPNAWQADFTEGLMIDYRHFDMANITPQYEFGFGLSYTTFDIGNISVTALTDGPVSALPPPAVIAPGGNPTLWDGLYRVTVVVSNTGDVGGATVAQLYLDMGSGAPEGTPVRVLRGFEKVSVQPGESTEVAFVLTRREISYWDIVAQNWRIPSGEMTVSVGLSSRDLRQEAPLTVL
ncbi:hypothetical protein W97_07797 [Coniosporium apollinis CBS 100218]|uniref:Probable beta-glucosidase G n=1 Tax=Coniosporium apollinis (strain CBS 100218) TaxID=1168221 RepID=R7Z3D3_CONA1|nr:uncharacterized protein W97_07797 [Coniosporium apollinis CBS 100218]EON68539.1 hypothetical protein W97_07797 [Coniosporium apollinis CBS 100218]